MTPWSAQTRWGSSTLTVAFKLLLKTALLEPSNQRFVLLDESAVPLYPAAAVYLQLMGETKSRVAACAVRCPRTNPHPNPALDITLTRPDHIIILAPTLDPVLRAALHVSCLEASAADWGLLVAEQRVVTFTSVSA